MMPEDYDGSAQEGGRMLVAFAFGDLTMEANPYGQIRCDHGGRHG